MSSAELVKSDAAWVRAGATFRLFMQLRILLAAATLLMIPRPQLTLSAFAAVCTVGLLSCLAVIFWEKVVPRLMKHPLLLSLDVLIAFGVLAVGGVDGPFFIFTVITSALAGVLYRWRGMLIVCALQVVLYYTAVAAMAGLSVSTTQMTISMPAFYPIAGFAGAALRRLLDDFAAVDAARIEAEVLTAAANERSRLAREMHDSLAKTLRGIALSATAIPRWIRKSPERAVEEAHRVASAVEIASREARSLIADLRDDAVQQRLGPALRSVAMDWREATGIEVVADISENVDLPLTSRHETVAILREILTNIQRHAHARRVEVTLEEIGDGVRLTVRDDGRGLDQPATTDGDLQRLARDGHFGIVGMHERARRAGGELLLTSTSGAGVTITVAMPAGGDASSGNGVGISTPRTPVEAA